MSSYTINKVIFYPGQYVARLVEIEEADMKYGPCLIWKFAISTWDVPLIVGRITSSESLKSSCSLFLTNILGRQCTETDMREIYDLIGSSYNVVIEDNNGYPRIERIWPLRRSW